ncbi:MAG: Rrf2 family transcriptional regulator, partial [Alphaproteobacteria bacterium HGW-Alphaproteobacteria-2]
MRLTIRTDIAMRALMYCALNEDTLVRRTDIAERCNTSPNHLAQVVHALAQRGFLATLRGRGGGIRLARPANEISVGAVFRALEGEVPFTECFDTCADGRADACPIRGLCPLHRSIEGALGAFYGYLDRITLADL